MDSFSRKLSLRFIIGMRALRLTLQTAASPAGGSGGVAVKEKRKRFVDVDAFHNGQ
jgi:hypothetical protein